MVDQHTEGHPMAENFELDTHQLGALPIINAFADRLGVRALLEMFLPHNDPRLKLAPATVISIVIRNLVIHRRPVYALGEWADPFDPALLGLSPGETDLLNDDRVGRGLARLFDADRASLLSRLILDAINIFDIDVRQLHNDSTSISFAGGYDNADGRPRGNKPTAAVTYGHSKARRPDLKQLVWILTVTADGAVPIAYRAVSGNTNDDTTHTDTWDGLAALVGRTDFLYVADSKLATRHNMDHIANRHGRFVSVLPATRNEDRQFRDWLADNTPDWTPAHTRAARTLNGEPDIWDTTQAPWPSAEGYRIVWVRSSNKTGRDADTRQRRINRGTDALDDINERLTSPKRRLKTLVAVQAAATAALNNTNSTRWITFNITETEKATYRQEKRGRPNNNTRYRKTVRAEHHITWTINNQQVAHDAASDGCYPLITNDTTMSGPDLLAAYKRQPNLEKRHAQLKGTQLVAPMFLHDPARIEGLLCCHFIAMLIQALIERHIRQAMTTQQLTQLSLYPEDRGCAAPTTARILEIFTGVARHHLVHDNHIVQTFQPELTDLQTQVLDLLDIPTSTYTTNTP